MSAAPQPYTRVTSFYSFEQTYPTQPKRGADLDAEFNAVRVSVNSTILRLAEVQRDDGKLANGIVHPQSLSDDTLVLLAADFEPRGSWVTATLYNPGDMIENNGLNYLAVTAHVSAATFEIDQALGHWQSFGGYPTAAQVVFAPGGTLAATNVQNALLELGADVQARQPIDAALTSLAATASAADKLPYFSGVDTVALTNLTTAARTFLAAVDAAAQQAAIGLVPGTDPGEIVMLDGAGKIPAVDGSQLTNVAVPNLSITDAKLATTLNLSGKTITLPAANTPVFTKSFESAQQAITFGGALTLAHGLTVKPKIMCAVLQCTTAELNYSIGDEVAINVGSSVESALDCGLSIVPDATNLSVRYGTNGITIINKGNGNAVQITAANWRLVLRAYA